MGKILYAIGASIGYLLMESLLFKWGWNYDLVAAYPVIHMTYGLALCINTLIAIPLIGCGVSAKDLRELNDDDEYVMDCYRSLIYRFACWTLIAVIIGVVHLFV
jgi:hypothetical protein